MAVDYFGHYLVICEDLDDPEPDEADEDLKPIDCGQNIKLIFSQYFFILVKQTTIWNLPVLNCDQKTHSGLCEEFHRSIW